MTVDFAGLEEALVMFERSKKLRAQESVAVRLRLHLIPFDTAKFPDLLEPNSEWPARVGCFCYRKLPEKNGSYFA